MENKSKGERRKAEVTAEKSTAHRPPSTVHAVDASSVYRIQEPASGLYVRFTCIPAPRDEAPKIVARLTRRPRATRFVSHQAAAECFARVLGAAPLEIVRCDA